MKKLLLLFFTFISLLNLSLAQSELVINNQYKSDFEQVYSQFPTIPKGILEAVAFHQTRLHHMTPDTSLQTCVGLPYAYGVMGLTLDGKSYFKDNLKITSELSGISIEEIIASPEKNILAYASAFSQISQQKQINSSNPEDYLPVLIELSELPNQTDGQNFALNSQLYEIYKYLNDANFQALLNLPNYKINFEELFGKNNLKILSAAKIKLKKDEISDDFGNTYQPIAKTNTSEYAPALWVAADASNYSSRSGTAISAVTIHDIEGSYAGCISWFQNSSANVSAHYVLRSSDGQVTQMVLEADKAWHVGSENPYCIGLEHEGYAAQTGWYTAAMYASSADLVLDITQSGYGIDPLRTAFFPWAPTTHYQYSSIPGSCVKIKGHQHYPNQTHVDPGENWDWKYYDNLINIGTSATTVTSTSGTITDNGGSAGNYPNDERQIISLQPTGASTVTISTVQFDLESSWDYLFVYDGSSVFSPLIGSYTGTTIPSSITSTGSSLTIELRSDCATTAPGFEFDYSITVVDIIPPVTTIDTVPWVGTDFTATFNDSDNVGGTSGIQHHFYSVTDYDGTQWSANDTNGFFYDGFNNGSISSDWTNYSGTWAVSGNTLEQTDESNTNTNISAFVDQSSFNKILYHWKGSMSGSGTNKRAGFHFMCDDPSQTNRGNSYFVWFREDGDKLQFYEVTNDTYSLVQEVVYTFNASQWYDFKVVYDKTTGKIDVYIDDVFVDSWTDATPLTTGDYISFRSGNAIYAVDDMQVYHNRTTSELITVGDDFTKTNATNPHDIRFESNPSTQAAGKISSIVIDNSDNISAIDTEDIFVDFSLNSLPISFSLVGEQSKGQNILNFDVKEEQNVKIYEFQHSENGLNFETFQKNAPQNNHLGSMNYAATDKNPSFGENYYRVKVIDFDGNENFSNVVVLENSPNQFELLSIYPIPAKQSLTIDFVSDASKSLKLELANVLGQVVHSEMVNAKTGTNKHVINLRSLSAGTYMLKISDNVTELNKKIVITK